MTFPRSFWPEHRCDYAHPKVRPQTPTQFEMYLFERIEGKLSGNWLDNFAFFEVVRASEMIGAYLCGGRRFVMPRSNYELRIATSEGYRTLSCGEPHLHASLDDARCRFSRRGQNKSPRSDFGPLYRWLYADTDQTDYSLLRASFSSYIQDTYGLSHDEIKSGKRIPNSISAIAVAHGLHPSPHVKRCARQTTCRETARKLPNLTYLSYAKIVRRYWRACHPVSPEPTSYANLTYRGRTISLLWIT